MIDKQGSRLSSQPTKNFPRFVPLFSAT